MTPSNKRLAWYALGAISVAALAGGAAYARMQQPRGNADSAPGRTARRKQFGDFAVIGRTVTVNKPREDVYRFCRDFSNLTQLLKDIAIVSGQGEGVTRWVFNGPAGVTITADTQILEDRPGEEISWNSTATSQLETRGKVMFRDAPSNRGTEVEAITAYRAPLGELGKMAIKVFGEDPAVLTRHALKRMKMLLETGEIATSNNRRNTQET